MEIKVNVGDPKAKKTHTFTISAEDATSIYDKKFGDTIRGELFDKAGYELEITGGSDNAGFPMRSDVPGHRRRKILITKSTGNKKTEKGIRVRKTVAGHKVGEFTSQINCKVVKYGKAPLVEPEAQPEAQAEKADAKPAESAPEQAPKETPEKDESAAKEATDAQEGKKNEQPAASEEKPEEKKDA